MERLAGELARGSGTSWREQGPLRSEITTLRRDLSHVTALLQSAGYFYEGYGRLLAPDTPESAADYSRAGQLTAVPSQTRMVVHG